MSESAYFTISSKLNPDEQLKLNWPKTKRIPLRYSRFLNNTIFHNSKIRPHFFYLLDYVTRRSEKLDFQKKKKKKRFWVSLAKKDHLIHIYVSMQKWHWFFTIRKIRKLWYTWIHFVIPIFLLFFSIADLKKFRLCNVIQQIKKVWPKHIWKDLQHGPRLQLEQNTWVFDGSLSAFIWSDTVFTLQTWTKKFWVYLIVLIISLEPWWRGMHAPGWGSSGWPAWGALESSGRRWGPSCKQTKKHVDIHNYSSKNY